MSLKPLNEALYETVHRGGKSPKQIADETGISYNYLMRMTMQTDSGCDFNLKFLVPVMKSADNFEVLKSLALLSGFLIIKTPKGTRKGSKFDLNEYQIRFSTMMSKLIQFAQEPSDQSYREVNRLLREHMADTENLRRRCKNNLLNQAEMF